MTMVLLVLMLQGTPQRPPAQPPATTTTASNPNADYVVGPQDRLNITVLGISEFSTAGVLVENDGMFSYLDLGRLQASGKTVREIQKEVHDLLIEKHMVVSPTVTVDVSDFRSQMVYVSGAVSRPQGYKVTGNETLLNVLAQAGFSAAAGQKIKVIRNKPIHQEYSFDRKALENGSAPSFQLQDGDAIIVPEAEKAVVRGEVHNPGLFEVSSETTVLQLIVMAGDFNDRAARGSVTIIRNDDKGKPKSFKVSSKEYATTPVKPGDIVEVKRRIL